MHTHTHAHTHTHMYVDINAHYFHLWSALDCKVKQLLEVPRRVICFPILSFIYFHIFQLQSVIF